MATPMSPLRRSRRLVATTRGALKEKNPGPSPNKRKRCVVSSMDLMDEEDAGLELHVKDEPPSHIDLDSFLPHPFNSASFNGTFPPDLKKALTHLLKSDPNFPSLLARSGPTRLPFKKTCSTASADDKEVVTVPRCAFQSLCSSIIYQQLNGKVASVILERFIGVFCCQGADERRFPRPEEVISVEDASLRGAGLSERKVLYVKALARAFLEGGLTTERLEGMTDLEIGETLIKIKGIGQWTIDMFLIFFLNRSNILSTGDLAVRKGMAMHFKKSGAKLPTPAEMEEWAKPWEPFRSYGTWYMWRLLDLDKKDGMEGKKKGLKGVKRTKLKREE
ncbi:hypothetical protein HDU67_005494 [Dinochytrium kinnereticum]|nr:hypothetical protein HDU67_005494 [Dinochytrium kinnereticum]